MGAGTEAGPAPAPAAARSAFCGAGARVSVGGRERRRQPACHDAAERRLRLRRRPLAALGAADRLRLLPLQALSAPHRNLGLDERPGARRHVHAHRRRGLDPRLAAGDRLAQALLRRMRLGPVHDQSRGRLADRDADGRLRRGSRRAPRLSPVHRLRAGMGAGARRRPPPLRGAGRLRAARPRRSNRSPEAPARDGGGWATYRGGRADDGAGSGSRPIRSSARSGASRSIAAEIERNSP